MEPRLSVDTSFLIDHQREYLAGNTGPAHRFLELHRDAELYLAVIALGEFAQGFGSQEDPVLLGTVRRHNLLGCDEVTALTYAKVGRALRLAGKSIGANDLWIGCTSLQHGLPVVTANVQEFKRIPGLRVIDYTAPGNEATIRRS